MSAKDNFHRAEHKYKIATGEVDKDMTFEEFQKKKDLEAKGNLEKAAAALKAAQQAAGDADKKAADAKAANEKKGLEDAEAKAHATAQAEQKKLQELIKSGKATQEDRDRAKAAMNAAMKAPDAVSAKATELE